MDSTFASALKKREELLAELNAVDQFLELFRRIFGDAGVVPQSANPSPDDRTGDTERKEEGAAQKVLATTVTVERKRGWSKEALRPHIEQAIRDAGKPLTRGMMLRALDQRKVPVGGGYDRSKNMGTIMWRLRDDFISLPGFGYWLRFEPYPAAEYQPEATESHERDQGSAGDAPQSDFSLTS